MLRFIWVFIYLFIFGVSNATFANYSKDINVCELLIAQENYSKALANYVSIFHTNKANFAIDIHNALLCAVITDNTKEIKYLSKLLALKGMPKDYFLKRSNFIALRNKKFWKKNAEVSQEIYQRNALKYERSKLLIDSVLNFDQENAALLRESANDRDRYDKYHVIVNDNAKFLANYFDSTYFPGDKLLIPYIRNDTSLSYIPDFYPVVVHPYQRLYSSEDTFFTKTLRDALTNSDIKPQTFAYLLDFGNVNLHYRPYYGTSRIFADFDGELYVQKYYYYDKDAREKVDSYRISIGMLPLGEAWKIANYAIKKGWNLGFVLDARITSFKGVKEPSEDYIKIK